MTQTQNYFWDSCVFAAFLRDETSAYDIDSIEQYLEEARDGKCLIYSSTMSSAEVLPSHLKTGAVGSFEEFLEDFKGAIIPIDPNPNIMTLSGALRDLPYKKGASTRRRLGTPDAVMLATAIHIQEAHRVSLTCFHTFDKGKKKDAEGTGSVPLIGYETWCEGFTPTQMALAKRVIDIKRIEPIHPQPHLFKPQPKKK